MFIIIIFYLFFFILDEMNIYHKILFELEELKTTLSLFVLLV